MKAMILAAGLSTRMKPLTDDLPKPLVPFFDRTLLEFQKFYLNHFGIKYIAMNTHYHQGVLKKFIANKKMHDIKLFFEPEILGTGGGIANIASFIEKNQDFVVINCDFITSIDLQKAIAQHKKTKALATMVLTPPRSAYGKVGYGSKLTLTEITPHQKNKKTKFYGHFTGIHIFNQRIFKYMPKDKNFFCINRDVYSHLIEQNLPVFAHVNSEDLWIDVGELRYYTPAHIQTLKIVSDTPWLSSYFANYKSIKSNLIHPSSHIGENVKMQQTFIGPNCIIEDDCIFMKGSILAGENQVTAKRVIKGGIIAKGEVI